MSRPFPIRRNADGTFSVKISCRCAEEHKLITHCPICDMCMLFAHGGFERDDGFQNDCPKCGVKVFLPDNGNAEVVQ